MLQEISLSDIDTPLPVYRFILLWKKRKHYSQTPTLTLGEVVELLIGTSYTFHKDFSDGRFFNNILIGQESVLAWDGDELIHTLYYELVQVIKKRIYASRTFNDSL